MVEIRRNLVNSNKYDIKCPYEMTPEFIVVHNTANDASAQNEVQYMINNNDKVSYHYAVDDKEIVQGIPVNRMAWHAGDGRSGNGNRKGISIEICYSKSGGDRFIQAEKNAAEFIASLLLARGWGIDRVKKHQDFMNKYCPHRTLDMGWQRFLDMVSSYMGNNNSQPQAQPTQTTKSIVDLANEVIAGKHGTGEARKQALGSLYNEVQAKVNEILGAKTTSKPALKSIDTIAQEVINGLWGNGEDRKTRLTNAGYNFNEVQNAVNNKLGLKPASNKKSLDTIAREVIAGKWGNGQDRKNRLAKAGYDYDAIQKRVNQLL